MIISFDHKFIFFGNGKTGTTSEVKALAPYNQNDKRQYSMKAVNLFAPKHLPPSLLRAMLFKYEVRDKVDKEAEELGVQKNVAKRNEIKTKYQNKYEDYLKEKYNFRFVEKNFANALDLATEKKKEQNLEKSDNK